MLRDIDRTLVSMVGLGSEIYALAFRTATGRDLEHFPDFAGRTDYELATATLAMHGIELRDGLLDEFLAALGRGTADRLADIRITARVHAGAHAAIEAFAGLRASVQTVATGNVPAAARTKLAAFGLDLHLDLDVGGYGSDTPDRAVLVGLARERAERKYRVRVADRRTLVVGDTPNDIGAARANGFVAIGVATGRFTADELREAGADLVLASLEGIAPAVELLRSL